jgi:hypothetical protein
LRFSLAPSVSYPHLLAANTAVHVPRTSENSVMAKFGIAPLQTAQGIYKAGAP